MQNYCDYYQIIAAPIEKLFLNDYGGQRQSRFYFILFEEDLKKKATRHTANRASQLQLFCLTITILVEDVNQATKDWLVSFANPFPM